MQACYSVQLTATAEQAYTNLHSEAQTCISKGDGSNKKVTFFNSVEEALDETIPVHPFDAGQELAGVLTGIYCLWLGPLCIYYAPDADGEQVLVLYIGTRTGKVDLTWLREALRDGNSKAFKVLRELGIDHNHLLKDAPTPTRWLN